MTSLWASRTGPRGSTTIMKRAMTDAHDLTPASGPTLADRLQFFKQVPLFADLTDADRRLRVGLVPQTAADLLYLETVAEECDAADSSAGVAAGTCAGILERLVPGVPCDTHPRDLSEGQRLALALAVILTSRPRVLLLDEPTRGLDYPGKHALAVILRAQAADGRAVLVSTHDVEFAAEVADRVVVLAEGEVVSSGPTRRVVAESPAFAPQVTKILGPPWLTVAELAGVAEPA